jgi:hypothetical protein
MSAQATLNMPCERRYHDYASRLFVGGERRVAPIVLALASGRRYRISVYTWII